MLSARRLNQARWNRYHPMNPGHCLRGKSSRKKQMSPRIGCQDWKMNLVPNPPRRPSVPGLFRIGSRRCARWSHPGRNLQGRRLKIYPSGFPKCLRLNLWHLSTRWRLNPRIKAAAVLVNPPPSRNSSIGLPSFKARHKPPRSEERKPGKPGQRKPPYRHLDRRLPPAQGKAGMKLRLKAGQH